MATVERIVRDRYSEGATARVDDLCCPVNYDPRYLEAIPEETARRAKILFFNYPNNPTAATADGSSI